MAEKKKAKSFEDNLNRLNEIVKKTENSVLPLEESFALYQEGMALIKELKTTLDNAQKEVEKLKDTSKE